MNTRTLIASSIPLLLAAALPAQVTYIDADHNTNTTLADGSPFAPNPANVGNDNNWSNRAFANNGTIYSSNDVVSTGFEDAPMLRTTISSLIPGLPYLVNVYIWSSATALWRGRCMVSSTQPSPELPGYNSRHFATSSFSPSTALASDAPTGPQQNLQLTYDASGFEIDGHFNSQVLIQEGDRWLYEIPLGTFLPDTNGEIHVYFDDLANTGNGNRTWFDGVGYEIAPLPFGSGCGNPTAPMIGHRGAPVLNGQFTVTQSGGTPNSPAVLVVGLSSTTWSGGALPFDFGFIGFPGCTLNVSTEATIPLSTDANGDAEFSVVISGVPSLSVYWQWLNVTAGGLEVTPGLSTQYHR